MHQNPLAGCWQSIHISLGARLNVATPHLGYVTRENYQIFYTDAVEDIEAWLKGKPIRVLPSPRT
jgi:phosphoglycerate dehydrogenase-like enzyme